MTLTDNDLICLSKKYVKETLPLLSTSYMTNQEVESSISNLEKALYFLKVIENLRKEEKVEE